MIDLATIERERQIARLRAIDRSTEGPDMAPCPMDCQLHRGCECPDDPDNAESLENWSLAVKCESQHNPNQSIATQIEQVYHNLRTWQSHLEMIRQAMGPKLPAVQESVSSLYDDFGGIATKTVNLYGQVARANLDATVSRDRLWKNEEGVESLLKTLRTQVTQWETETLIWALLNEDGSVLKTGLHGGQASDQVLADLSDLRMAVKATRAPYAVLVHTHGPSDNATPSRNDVMTTMRLGEALHQEHVALLDHFVLTRGGSYTSIRTQIEDWTRVMMTAVDEMLAEALATALKTKAPRSVPSVNETGEHLPEPRSPEKIASESLSV